MPGRASRIATFAALVLFGAVLAARGLTDSGAKPAPAAFERFKALAGEWVSAEDGEMAKRGDLVARYAVTAGGSAVVETIFPGQAHEMVTVTHADGGTNIDPKRDRHMHSASLALLGADEIRTEWTELAEGKAVLVVRSHLVRKAR